MSADFFGAREQEKCRAPFSSEDFVDVARRGRVRLDATGLMGCGRHGDATQTATLRWRGMSLYLSFAPRKDVLSRSRTGLAKGPSLSCSASPGPIELGIALKDCTKVPKMPKDCSARAVQPFAIISAAQSRSTFHRARASLRASRRWHWARTEARPPGTSQRARAKFNRQCPTFPRLKRSCFSLDGLVADPMRRSRSRYRVH